MKRQLRRLLLVSLLTVACLYTYRLENSETHTYAAAGVTKLSASTQNGAINVARSPDTAITVKVTRHAYGRDSADASKAIANVSYSDTVVGSALSVRAEMPSGSRPYGASFAIAAPESIDVSLSTTNGDVGVTGTLGTINASTSNGDVALTGTTGAAVLSATNGKLDVRVHSGAVAGTTTNATIDCDLAALAPAETVGLATTNGDVTLLLPDDVSAVIDVTNTNGIITIYDFTVIYDVQTEHHVRGRVGSGASTITITTTNGDVVVRRRS